MNRLLRWLRRVWWHLFYAVDEVRGDAVPWEIISRRYPPEERLWLLFVNFRRIRNRLTGSVRYEGPLPPEHLNCRCASVPAEDTRKLRG